MSSHARVNVVVALKAEARPLLRRYNLKPAGQSGLYANESGDLGLMVGGVGRTHASRAVGLIHHTGIDSAPTAWLNVGIAGHGSAPPGTALLAREVLERASGRCLYPRGDGLAFPGVATTAVCTVDEPETDYQPDWAYDMEASGFMDAALRVSGPRPVQCLKIVSDGPTSSCRNLSAHMVEELVDSCTEAVDEVLVTQGLSLPAISQR